MKLSQSETYRNRDNGHFFFFIISFLISIWLSLPLSAAGPDTRQAPLLFVADENYPPITFMQDGRPKGLYVDIARALSSKMKRPIEIRLLNWAEAQKMVLDGRADAADGMAINAERLKVYDFSETLLDLTYSFFQMRNNPVIKDLSFAAGKRIGATLGGYPSQFLKDYEDIRVVDLASYEEGFDRLAAGDIDALAADSWVAAYLIEQKGLKDVTASEVPFAVRKSAIAVKKGNSELLAEINAAIAQIRDAELPQILNQSAPKQMFFLSQESLGRIVFVAGLSILVLLVLIMALWIRSLKKSQRARDQSMTDLAVSEERFRALFENAPEAIVLYDADAERFVDANPKALALFGLSMEELRAAGDRAGNDSPVYADSVRCFLNETAERASTGMDLRYEGQFKNQEGKLTTCEIQLMGLPSKDHRLLRASYVDVTERKRYEENLRKLNQQLDERVRERTRQLEDANHELLGSLELQRKLQSELIVREKVANILPMSTILAHKLNTPVGNIITAATAMHDKTERVKALNGSLNRMGFQDFLSDVAEASELIAGSAGKAANLIKSYQNVIVDRSNAVQSVFSVAETVEQMVSVLRSLQKNPNLNILVDIDHSLVMDGFSGLLAKVVNELVQNAFIHAFDPSQPGTVAISAKAENEESLVLSVEDDGRGIADEDRIRVFEPFYMADMARGGSGLGLTTVYDIVTGTMRGFIRIENAVPRGCRFVATLPLKLPQ